MTPALSSSMPESIFDLTLPTSTRRAALERWWTRRRRVACRPRPLAVRVLGPDGRWYRSGPTRPLLAGALLSYACSPRPPSPAAIPPLEELARDRWAETMSVEVFGPIADEAEPLEAVEVATA